MFFSTERKVKRIERQIAGKKARLEATQKLADGATTIPGQLVRELQSLPQQIAELEVALKQMAPNVLAQGRGAGLPAERPSGAAG